MPFTQIKRPQWATGCVLRMFVKEVAYSTRILICVCECVHVRDKYTMPSQLQKLYGCALCVCVCVYVYV